MTLTVAIACYLAFGCLAMFAFEFDKVRLARGPWRRLGVAVVSALTGPILVVAAAALATHWFMRDLRDASEPRELPGDRHVLRGVSDAQH